MGAFFVIGGVTRFRFVKSFKHVREFFFQQLSSILIFQILFLPTSVPSANGLTFNSDEGDYDSYPFDGADGTGPPADGTGPPADGAAPSSWDEYNWTPAPPPERGEQKCNDGCGPTPTSVSMAWVRSHCATLEDLSCCPSSSIGPITAIWIGGMAILTCGALGAYLYFTVPVIPKGKEEVE